MYMLDFGDISIVGIIFIDINILMDCSFLKSSSQIINMLQR